MKRVRRGTGGRWRSAFTVGLVVAAMVMVAVLALQAVYAASFHRRAAEAVLRDYARVAADEFIRRATIEIGYHGYYSLAVALKQELAGRPDPVLPEIADLEGAVGGQSRPAHEMVGSLFLIDLTSGSIAGKGWPLDAGAAALLRSSTEASPPDAASRPHPFTVRHQAGEQRQRTFVSVVLPPAGGGGPWLAGFEVDLDALEPWLQRVLDAGPLLPASLGDGRVTNDILSVRLNDAAGHQVFVRGADPDPALTAYAPFAGSYNGMFDGMTLLTSIPREAAPRLVIGGLPRSRLPALLTMLVLTIGLLTAAIHQLRRERALARMRSEFVSRVSHELRTPLTQIRMFAETLLLERVRTEEERRRSLEIVDQEARRLGHLVENVLLFSCGERGAIRLAMRPVDMGALARDVVEKFKPVARAKRATIVPEIEGGVVCEADDDAMRQVVLNLLDNAVKYGPAGQEVHLGVESRDGRARIWIDDAGPGVPEHERGRIWLRWRRLEREEIAAVSGSGIGLTVVRDLVAMHRGTAWVEESSRRGARFIVEIPRTP